MYIHYIYVCARMRSRIGAIHRDITGNVGGGGRRGRGDGRWRRIRQQPNHGRETTACESEMSTLPKRNLIYSWFLTSTATSYG